MTKKKKTLEQQEAATSLPVAEVDPRIEMTQGALAAFPSLSEGYLTRKGIYFDREVAEKSLEGNEDLIIVQRPSKK